MADKRYKLNFNLSDGTTKEVEFEAPQGEAGAKGSDGKSAYAYAQEGGFGGTEAQFASLLNIPIALPQFYGAVGDGTTDDTAAVQSALTNNRYVYIPGGTYKLSGALNIRDGCRLELAPDAVLNFTQTSGNCITLGMSAALCGNFATLVVPYAFSGNVIYISTASSTTLTGVPPFTRWTPQWKPARYVSDIYITKPDSRGFHYSIDGTCSGTAVYIEADGSATSTFIWGARLTGLRIAGAFSYGIHGKCLSNGWNHEMHLEAVIDACEIGVCLEDSNNNYVTATIQPRAALTTDSQSIAYAKHGIQLIRCRNTDLSRTRVWDWNATNSLWTATNEYQHISLIGNCSGTILNDFLYYEMPGYDIRSLIYTDTDSNLEKINILQEPFTRWFKPSSDGVTPLFYNGSANKELLQKDDFDALFQTNPVANFTNQLARATDMDGAVFNGVGYQTEATLSSSDGNTVSGASGLSCTGFIPCSEGAIVRMKGISFAQGDNSCRVYLYDENKTKLLHVGYTNLISNGSYFNIDSYTATEDGCSFRIVLSTAAYLRMVVYSSTIGKEPIITTDEEISYTQEGFLADSVKVKAASVYGLEEYVKAVIAANG